MMLFSNSAAVDADQCRTVPKAQYPDACGRSRSRSKQAGGAVTTGVPRRFIRVRKILWALSRSFWPRTCTNPLGLSRRRPACRHSAPGTASSCCTLDHPLGNLGMQQRVGSFLPLRA